MVEELSCRCVEGNFDLRNSLDSCLKFRDVISFPEFEVCATLKEVTHTFGFLDTRHFHHDLTHLTLTTENLDVGLSHTETVDTRAYNFVRVCYSGFNFFDKHLLYFFVSRSIAYALFLELCSEDTPELIFTLDFLIRLYEEVYEVAFTLLRAFLSLAYSSEEVSVLSILFASEVLYHVGYTHFENDIHTALEVKTETDFEFFAFLEGLPAEVNLFVAHRIEVSDAGINALSCCDFCSLLLVVVRYKREREIEAASQEQQYGDCFYKSFVLHCC